MSQWYYYQHVSSRPDFLLPSQLLFLLSASPAALLLLLLPCRCPVAMALDLRVDLGVGLDQKLRYKVWEPQLIIVAQRIYEV